MIVYKRLNAFVLCEVKKLSKAFAHHPVGFFSDLCRVTCFTHVYYVTPTNCPMDSWEMISAHCPCSVNIWGFWCRLPIWPPTRHPPPSWTSLIHDLKSLHCTITLTKISTVIYAQWEEKSSNISFSITSQNLHENYMKCCNVEFITDMAASMNYTWPNIKRKHTTGYEQNQN